MTLFKSAIAICGMSQGEAADWLGVSPETVKSWCQGRRGVPDGVWDELAALYVDMRDSVEIGPPLPSLPMGSQSAIAAMIELESIAKRAP